MLAPPHVSSTSYSNCQIVPPRSKLTVCVSVTDFWMELLTLLELSRAADPDTSVPPWKPKNSNSAETVVVTSLLHEASTVPPFSFTVPSMYETSELTALVDECTFHSPLADATVHLGGEGGAIVAGLGARGEGGEGDGEGSEGGSSGGAGDEGGGRSHTEASQTQREP